MRKIQTAVLLCLCAFTAFAQSDRGTITGTVTDATGATVANATVEARQLESGSLFPTTTTDTGNYTLVQLPVGPYEVTITSSGFKKFVRSGLTVQVAQTIRIDAQLQIGAASESVTVSAEASLLKTETGDVSHNVEVSQLDTLPMLSAGSAAAGSSGIRNPNNVLNVVPGVYYVPNSQVKINGAQSNSYAYHVEGMDSTNAGFPYAAAQTQPSVDAIQEVAVQTSNFAPEFGAVGGGFFNVTMRSGGNHYHGTAYDYIVNEVLNAGTPYAFANPNQNPAKVNTELNRQRARRHDYGWTIGGPVSIPKIYSGKDKTFFFFNFEQFRETQFTQFVDTVPTLDYRKGDFSKAITAAGSRVLGTDSTGRQLLANQIFDPGTNRTVNGQLISDPFPNNNIPLSRMDPVALKVQSLIPNPTSTASFQNYLTTQPSVRHTTIPAVKIDHLIGAKQKIAFYWSFTHTDSQYSQIYGNYEGLLTPITQARGTFIHSHVERLNYDYTLTPTLLLHLGVGYQQNNFFDDAPVLDFNAEKELGLKGATVNRNFPNFNGFCAPANCSTSPAGGMLQMGTGGQTHSYWEKPTGISSITWIKGAHTIKAGADMYWSAVPQTPYTNNGGQYQFSPNQTTEPYLVGTQFSGGNLGFAYSSFLLGRVDQYQIAASANFRQAKKQLGFYAQDSFKIRRNLTLDYGVRYDYGSYFREEHGRAVNFSPTTPNPSAGGAPGGFIFEGDGPGHCNCNFAKNYPYAFGPRLGLAYSVNPKTVVRLGWGLIYGQTSTNPLGINTAGIVNTQIQSSPGQGNPALILQNGIPNSPTWPVFNAGVAPLAATGNSTLPGGVGLLDPSAGRPPRQNQWSIGIQHEIMPGLAIEAAYVANRGVWWQAPTLVDVNAITPAILKAKGIDISSAADQSLLLSALSSTAAQARGFKAPYTGFGLNQTVAQSIRPFPQFANIPVSGNPMGKTWYDSLQTKLTKRLSHGLTMNGTFTWQKSLQVGTDTNANTTVAGTQYANNVVAGPLAGKSISVFDQPYLFTVAGSYMIPKIAMLKKASYVVQDWQIGTLLNYASGLPIAVAASTSSIANQLFQPSLMNRVSGEPLYLVSDLNCHCFDPAATPVLNPKAWTNPPAGQFASGSPFYSDYRQSRHPGENINLGRTFHFREKMSLNLRVEFSNIFNRAYIANPTSTNPTAPVTRDSRGNLTGGFGYINTAFLPTNQQAQPRNGTIVARFTF